MEATQKAKDSLQEKVDAADLAANNAKQEVKTLTAQVSSLQKQLDKVEGMRCND